MSFVGGVWLVLLGMVGAAYLISARRPDARSLIERLAPYQGWGGAVSVVWGIAEVVGALLALELIPLRPVAWLVWLVDGLLLVGLGLLLGADVIKSFISSVPAQRRLDAVVARLAPYRGALGLAAIGVGLWAVIASVYYHL